MFFELQQSLARQWLDMAEANVRLATDLGFGAARAATQAMDGAGAGLPLPSSPMLPFAWPWPGMGGGLPMPATGWPFGPAAMAPQAWMMPFALAAMALPMAGTKSWPSPGAWSQAPAMFGIPMPGSARQSQSPMAQATADFGDAMLSAYRSASGFAAAMNVLAQPPAPEPRKAQPAPEANPWLAMWDVWLPRR